jgi:hypothetical protein
MCLYDSDLELLNTIYDRLTVYAKSNIDTKTENLYQQLSRLHIDISCLQPHYIDQVLYQFFGDHEERIICSYLWTDNEYLAKVLSRCVPTASLSDCLIGHGYVIGNPSSEMNGIKIYIKLSLVYSNFLEEFEELKYNTTTQNEE